MQKLIFLLAFLIVACSQVKQDETSSAIPETLTVASLDTFPINSSIRALKALDENTAWFAGSKGYWGYTENGGQTWKIDSIRVDTIIPHFRGIAMTDQAVFLLSIASPTLIFRSENKGQDWTLVYRDDAPNVFHNAIAFWNENDGLVIGDPMEGCLSMLLTNDGGRSWQKIPCDRLPATEEGEAGFAASNTNIATHGDQGWIVSGGKRARVFHTNDKGQSWEVFDTPILEGGQMTGIYSVAFQDENNGIIFGGDWNEKDKNVQNKATTKDGGKTWNTIAEGKNPGYRSCVRYIPTMGQAGIAACGIPGISYSLDGGTNWVKISDKAYYTMDFGSGWETLWLAGNGNVARIKFE